MTHLASLVEVAECSSSGGAAPEVAELVSRVLIPKVITRSVIESYLCRALRSRAWFRLSRVERALLKVAHRVVEVVKSPALADVLRKVFLEIELNSLKGRALYFGFLLALRMGEPLAHLLRRLTYVMMLGINYLSNPPLFRVFG